MTMMRVTILTEAGPNVGLGHLARCVALYDALDSVGATCQLVVAGEAPAHVVGERSVREHDWSEAREAVECVAGADVAIVDSYQAELPTYQAVAGAVGVAVYFDDTARVCYPRGIIINGMPDAEALYFGLGSDRIIMAGPAYQVLRREFWDAPPFAVRPTVERVLVVAGGTDAAGAMQRLAVVAARACPNAEIDAVDAPRDAATMARSMRAADVAITAAGQMLYELAAMGTPMVAVCVADNQVAQAGAFESAGAVRLAGAWSEPETDERVASLLADLAGAESRAVMSAAARALVDGRGAVRVARCCARAVVGSRVRIEPATFTDEAALLALANDDLVRRMSFSSERIARDEHHRWLCRVLGDPNVLLLVARDGGRLAGQVRFDMDASQAAVSISLTVPYRGLGLARLILEDAISLLRSTRPEIETLVAWVKADNVASCAFFESAGFEATNPARVDRADAVLFTRDTAEHADADSLS